MKSTPLSYSIESSSPEVKLHIESFSYFEKSQNELTPFIYRLNTVLKINYSNESFDSSKLSKELCLCPMQVYRKVKEQTGLSPSKYLLLYRLKKAIDLLKLTEYSIGEVSFSVGFTNQNNFARAFKREFGFSPCQIRAIFQENVIKRLKNVIL
jgi:AraC-like DNA-binding protein